MPNGEEIINEKRAIQLHRFLLKTPGVSVPDFDRFSTVIQDENKLKDIHSFLSQQNPNFGGFNAFRNKLFEPIIEEKVPAPPATTVAEVPENQIPVGADQTKLLNIAPPDQIEAPITSQIELARRKIFQEAQDEMLAGLTETTTQRQLEIINNQMNAEEEGTVEEENLLDRILRENFEKITPPSSTLVTTPDIARTVFETGIRQQKDFLTKTGLFVEEEGKIIARNPETIGQDMNDFYTNIGISNMSKEESQIFQLVEQLNLATTSEQRAGLVSQIKEIDPEWEMLYDFKDSQTKERLFEIYKIKTNQFLIAKRGFDEFQNFLEKEKAGRIEAVPLGLNDPNAPIYKMIPELTYLNPKADRAVWLSARFERAKEEFETVKKALLLNKNLTGIDRNFGTKIWNAFEAAVESSPIGPAIPGGINSGEDYVRNSQRLLAEAGIELTEEQKERTTLEFGNYVADIGGSIVGILPTLMMSKRVTTSAAKRLGLLGTVERLKKGGVFQKGQAFLLEAGLEETALQLAGFEPGTGAIFYGTGRILGAGGMILKGKFGSILSPLLDKIVAAGISGTAGMEASHIFASVIETISNDEEWDGFWERAGYADLSEAGKRIGAELIVGGMLGMPFRKTGETNAAKVRMSKFAEELEGLGKTEDAAFIRENFLKNAEKSVENNKDTYNLFLNEIVKESAARPEAEKITSVEKPVEKIEIEGKEVTREEFETRLEEPEFAERVKSGEIDIKVENIPELEAKVRELVEPVEEFAITPSQTKGLLDRGFKVETLDKASEPALRRLVEEKELKSEEVELTEKGEIKEPEVPVKEVVEKPEEAVEKPVVEKPEEKIIEVKKADIEAKREKILNEAEEAKDFEILSIKKDIDKGGVEKFEALIKLDAVIKLRGKEELTDNEYAAATLGTEVFREQFKERSSEETQKAINKLPVDKAMQDALITVDHHRLGKMIYDKTKEVVSVEETRNMSPNQIKEKFGIDLLAVEKISKPEKEEIVEVEAPKKLADRITKELDKLPVEENPINIKIDKKPLASVINSLPKEERAKILPKYREKLEKFKEEERVLTRRFIIEEPIEKGKIDAEIAKAKKAFEKSIKESRTKLTAGGVDPNVLSALLKLAALHIKKGVKSAAGFAKAINQELTDVIKETWDRAGKLLKGETIKRPNFSSDKLTEIEKKDFDKILNDSIEKSEGDINKLRNELGTQAFSYEFSSTRNTERGEEFKRISDALKNTLKVIEKETDITKIKDLFDLETGKIKASELIERGQRDDVFKGNPAAEKVEATFKKQRDDFNNATKSSVGDYFTALKKGLITKFVDVSGNLKNELMNAGGIDVIIKKDLVAGSSKKSRDEYLKSEKEIFEGLTKPQEELLADMIQDQSTIEIHKLNDARGEKRTKRPGGVQLEEAQEHLDILKRNDSELFDKLQKRGDIYFNKLQELLKTRLDEGIISQESFDALKDNVRYSPSLYLKFLVEPSSTNSLGGNKISVSKSDIKKRGEGSEESLFNDPRFLLKDAILRVNRLVAKNKASKALFDFVKENPENKIVTIDKPIRFTKDKKPVFKKATLGFERINVLIDGKQNSMLMPKEWAEEWIAREPVINQALANSLRIFSGGFILRPMATGINPAFALSNVPRDIAHVLFVTDVYSPILPIALKQIAADIIKVTPDVLKRTGRYDGYIKEGGGMKFLTQQGNILKTGDIPKTKVGQALKAFEYYSGFINETSELLVRVAIRERSINKQLKELEKKGVEPTDKQLQEVKERATWEARNQLDFAQGGSWMKGLDNIFPYANASMQGARTFFRTLIRDPKNFAFKTAQIGGFAAGLYLYNMKQEGWDDISDDIKRRNFIFMTPIWTEDDQGRKKFRYISIPKSPDQIVITGLFEGLAHWTNTGELPQKKMIKELSDAIPFFPIARDRPPMIETFMAYESNWDNFRDTEIWKGQRVENWAEFYKNTPGFFKDIGKAFDLSPARLEAASAKTTTMLRFNVYGIMGLKAYDLLQEGFTDTEKEEMNKSIIEHADDLAHPIYRRLLKETTPGVSMESLERFTIEENTRKKIQNDKVKDFITEIDKETASKADFERWVQEQPDVDRDRLTNMFDLRQQRKDVDYFWIEMAFMPSPEVKAFVFHSRWKDATDAGKKQMIETINKVGKINTERFRIRFAELSNGVAIPGGTAKGRRGRRARGRRGR